MECPHLISDCKINGEFVKTKKCQLTDKQHNNPRNNNNNSTTVTGPASTIIAPQDDIEQHDNGGTSKSVGTNQRNNSTIMMVAGKSQDWKCAIDECDSKNNWMCLNCGTIHCGRYEKKHALTHFITTNHKICMNVLDFSVYCYQCDNYIVNSTLQLNEIRQCLQNENYIIKPEEISSATSANIEESLSGSSIRSSSNNSNASVSSNDSSWEEPLQQTTTTTTDVRRRLRPRKRTNSNDSSTDIGNNSKGRKVQRKSSTKDTNESNNNSKNSGTSSSSSVTGGSGGRPTQKRNFRRFVGLQNFGATCFVNSVLQSLNNIQQFSGYISSLPNLDKEINSNNNNNNSNSNGNYNVTTNNNMKENNNYNNIMILKDLRRLLIDLNKNSDRRVITPDYLLNWNFPHFDMFNQNDAHEFLHFMLNRLHTELQHLPINKIESLSSSTSTSSSNFAIIDSLSIDSNSNSIKKLNSTKDQDNNSNGCVAFDSDPTNKNNHNSDNSCSNSNSSSSCNSSNNGGNNNMNCNNNNSEINNCKCTIVTKVFGGMLQNVVRCLICGLESKNHDPFLDLSLDIPEKFFKDYTTTTTTASSTTLDNDNNDNRTKNSKHTNVTCNIKDCISSFMTIEKLAERERYYCSSCKCKRESTKRFWIKHLPNVLCLHIKRFHFNPRRYLEPSKINLKIAFPLKELDMSQYVLGNSNSSENQKNNSTLSNIYDLSAVIVHHGKIATFGHYTSYAVNNGTWLHFNDKIVKEVTSSEVAECEPYMLFYIRRDSSNINSNNNDLPSSSVSLQNSLSLLNQQKTTKSTENLKTSSDIDDSNSNNNNLLDKSAIAAAAAATTAASTITNGSNKNSTLKIL